MRRSVEVLIVGAGPAGIAAALAAAKHSRSVMVLDDNKTAGGQIWREGIEAGDRKDSSAKSRMLVAFRSCGAELLAGRRVVDVPETHLLRAVVDTADGTQVQEFAWKRLILATGARERFLPFPGWTKRGVFGAGGLQALVQGGFSVAGKRVVVAGTGPLLLAVAVHLQEYGAKVVSIAEQAPMSRMIPFAASLWSHPAKVLQGIRYRAALARVPYRMGCWPVAATGEESVTGVRLTDGTQSWEEPCDLLSCGFHLVPNTELAALLGCAVRDGFVVVDQGQQTSVADVFCAGEPTGIAGLDAALVQGEIAGLAVCDRLQDASNLQSRREREQGFGARLAAAFSLRAELRSLAEPDTIVCRCEDVSYNRLTQYPSWTEAKLQTRCGMGPCQGRVCGPAVQTLFGWQPGSVRPPLFPMPIACFHGDGFNSQQEATDLQEIS